MTKEQAWQIVINMYSKFLGTEQDHNLVKQALVTLKDQIFVQEPKASEKPIDQVQPPAS